MYSTGADPVAQSLNERTAEDAFIDSIWADTAVYAGRV